MGLVERTRTESVQLLNQRDALRRGAMLAKPTLIRVASE